MKISPAYLARIRAAYPALALKALDFNQDGTVNDVVVVDGDLVCRFPKHDWARDVLLHEARVLQLVSARLSVAVPQFQQLGPDFASYRFLPGTPLTRTVLLRLSAHERLQVLTELGHVLHQLHSVTPAEAASAGIGASDANRSPEDWTTFYSEVKTVLFPLLMRHQRDWVREHFGPVLRGELDLSFAPALTHGDLGVYHILYDRAQGRLSGIIDFGTAGLGDPATDFAALLDGLGESLVMLMERAYPGLPALLDRARFRMGTLGLQWALAGVRQDDKPLLLAHLAGARDVGPIGTEPAVLGQST